MFAFDRKGNYFKSKLMKVLKGIVLLFLGLWSSAAMGGTLPPIQTVFIILMENHNWAELKGNPDAPYINNTLLPMASHCEQYYNPPALHPSLPNYLWLEAGTNFGVLDDNDPAINHQNTTNHLTAQLQAAGISWKTYQEGIDGTTVPLTGISTNFAPKHCPFLYFDDVTGTNDANNAYGIAHIRPFTELAGDLASNQVARYNFLTPSLCNDTHDCPVSAGDAWLAAQIPLITNSSAFKNNGALFITFDEGEGGKLDGPIAMILLSPYARGGGYFNNLPYDHSSTLRTLQEIFNVSPWLGGAATANDLSDLFSPLRILSSGGFVANGFQLKASGLIPGTTNVIQLSTDTITWTSLSTNVPVTTTWTYLDTNTVGIGQKFYRLVQWP